MALSRCERTGGTKHGHSNSPTYISWYSMLNRCLNKNSKTYNHYGGNGIKVCVAWLKFENFLSDMGCRPEGQSLDRIDSTGNYEPGNCRWADRFVQARNKRTVGMTAEVAALIRRDLNDGLSKIEIVRKHSSEKVSRFSIYRVLRGDTWVEVSASDPAHL